MKILMTDDDSDDRYLALMAFKHLNMAHSMDFVSNGEELLSYLTDRVDSRAELPDLILLDLNMPKMDGREALKEIKSNPKLKHVDVIIFSTSNSTKDMEYTLGLGARKYIVKPKTQEELSEMFQVICDELVSKPGWHYSIDKSSRKRSE